MNLMISETALRPACAATHADVSAEMLAGYRWGIERKRELIRREAMA